MKNGLLWPTKQVLQKQKRSFGIVVGVGGYFGVRKYFLDGIIIIDY